MQVEESGIWEKISRPFKSAWNWAGEKVSDAWERSKEKASAAWDDIVEVISRIADVVVNAGTAMWNWILEHKGPVVAILSILGVVVTVIGFIFSAPVAVMIGGAILIGELVSGLFSWISGNGFFSDEMLLDMLIGGIAGGIASLFGWAAGVGAVGSSAVRWLGTRIPWLGRAFPKILGGSVGAGVDQSLWDLLKEGKINWKNALIAGGLGFVMLLGGEHVGVKFFKNCVAYEQPTNSYLAVMLPKLDCFYSPDWSGGTSTGKVASKRIVDEFGNAIPYGFSSLDDYYKFVDTLKKELPGDTTIIFQGSSVTGKSHKTGKAFDKDRTSDFDIALINDDIVSSGVRGKVLI